MSTYSFRITTNGVMRNYRSNLYKSYNTLNTAMERLQTHREFNSYAEDPTAANQAFQLRRSIWRTNDQLNNTNNTIGVFDTAFSAMGAICDGNADHPSFDEIAESLELITGTTGSGRAPLGQSLVSTADSIMHMMNSQYGGDYIFAGADGQNIPFTWGENLNGDPVILYRGVDLNTPNLETLDADEKTKLDDWLKKYNKWETDHQTWENNGKPDPEPEQPMKPGTVSRFEWKYGMTYKDAIDNHEKIQKMLDEHTYVDIGLGLQEDANGEIIPTSAYDSCLRGLEVLGWGVDEDGDSKNLVNLMRELGEIAKRCDPNSGEFAEGDEDRALVLAGKMRTALDGVAEQYVKICAEVKYLDSNVEQLNDSRDSLDAQRAEIEQVKPALAIEEMNWANYSYQAALKIGNSILSQSLIDFMT